MNIAYSCNDYYIPQTGISIISLCENNKDVDDLVIYFIGKDVNKGNIEILKNITEKYNREFIYVNFDSIAYDLNISAIGRHIETIYTKVFFSRISNLDRIIYLDSDTIVRGSLYSLWQIDIENAYMGVVQTFSKEKAKLGMPENAPFFNDGMAIVNVKFCRENNLIQKVLKVVDEYNGNPPTLSEGALNKVCMGRVKFISLKWNCMAGLLYFGRLDIDYLVEKLDQYTKSDLQEAIDNPTVVHFLTAFYNRPWFTPCNHPYKDDYFTYKKISPWKNDSLKRKKLPLRIKLIDLCYRYLGTRITEKIRKIYAN